ncbi:MAG TPA: M67 family metallopeptidase [Thermodesulfovibrionales bacterium]|nr:M67 family metallopeptidase [Thermodesulfovibrionales bacterium]
MSRSGLLIPKDLYEQVCQHCLQSYPNEACGILSGKNGKVNRVYTVKNIEPSPVSYFMDPREQLMIHKELRQRNEDMVAIFHSHPQSPAYPSAKDVNLAFYEDTLYVIVSLSDGCISEMKAYSIVEGTVSEIMITMTG